jgi:hypothetical protein
MHARMQLHELPVLQMRTRPASLPALPLPDTRAQGCCKHEQRACVQEDRAGLLCFALNLMFHQLARDNAAATALPAATAAPGNALFGLGQRAPLQVPGAHPLGLPPGVGLAAAEPFMERTATSSVQLVTPSGHAFPWTANSAASADAAGPATGGGLPAEQAAVEAAVAGPWAGTGRTPGAGRREPGLSFADTEELCAVRLCMHARLCMHVLR